MHPSTSRIFASSLESLLFVCVVGNGVTGQARRVPRGCALTLRAKAGPKENSLSCHSRGNELGHPRSFGPAPFDFPTLLFTSCRDGISSVAVSCAAAVVLPPLLFKNDDLVSARLLFDDSGDVAVFHQRSSDYSGSG